MFLPRHGATREAALPAVTNVAGDLPNELPAAPSSGESENKQSELVTIPEMRQIQQSGAPSLILDVRAERSFADSDLLAQAALRVPPDRTVERLKELDVPRHTWLFVFCA
jgi:hypothetical protein